MLSLSTAAVVATTAFASSFVCTWAVRGAMRRANIMDVPSEPGKPGARKTHGRPVAYEGGLAMYLAFLVAVVVAGFLDPSFFFEQKKVIGLIVGGGLIVALGVADDLLDLRPLTKLAGQIGVAVLMFAWGYRVMLVTNPFGEQFMAWGWGSFVVTVLWYALLMNGLNLVDGLDGLAAGIAAISAVTLCAISFDLGQDIAFAVALILIFVCAGFLPFNFAPATIFMGDAGSLLLGFLLASITLLSSTKSQALLTLLIPVLAVGLPVFETAFSFLRRILKGRHPFKADRRHLHHRFLALGFSPRRTVLTFYYLTVFLGVIAYVVQRLEPKATLALVLIVAIGGGVAVENMRFLERSAGFGTQDSRDED